MADFNETSQPSSMIHDFKIPQLPSRLMSQNRPPAAPEPVIAPTDNQSIWMDASDFTGAENANDWDFLVTRGTGVKATANKWDRNSLFQKFDPLCSRRSSVNNLQVPRAPKFNESNESMDERSETDNCGSYYTACNVTPTTTISTNSFCSPNSRLVSAAASPNEQGFVHHGNDFEIKTSPRSHNSTFDFPNNFSVEDQDPPSISPSSSTDSPVSINLKLEDYGHGQFDESQQAMLMLKDKCIMDLQNEIKEVTDECNQKTEKEDALIKEKQEQVACLTEELEKLENQLSESIKLKKVVTLERKEALEDLNEMESAFADVLLSYEGGKALVKNFEQNQKILNKREKELETALAKREEKLAFIQKRLNESTECCKRDNEARLKEVETENTRLKAKLRMAEMKARKLESEIEQTVVESTKLKNLCDELLKS